MTCDVGNRGPGLEQPQNCISSVMGNMLALSAVDHSFQSESGQAKNYKAGICCVFTIHALN